jgi:hypothetical protein
MHTKDLFRILQLKPHPEGGYYRETYRSEEKVTTDKGNVRNLCTGIYYLLEDNDKSCFHRISSDEQWFFHQGQAIEIFQIIDGRLVVIQLGNDVEKGELPQVCIPAHTWFAAKIGCSTGYSLVSCTVSPGFDFADFELAARADLIVEYPGLKRVIVEFTK